MGYFVIIHYYNTVYVVLGHLRFTLVLSSRNRDPDLVILHNVLHKEHLNSKVNLFGYFLCMICKILSFNSYMANIWCPMSPWKKKQSNK